MSEIIDGHTHLFPETLADRAVAALHEAYAADPVRRPVAEQLIAEMDASGVTRATVAPVSTKPSQVRSI
ncbi:MAG: amidohydrolase, partial [Armatimonadetes bacterium]|nr:amidohydrolase [Armatimonadota bacterium]